MTEVFIIDEVEPKKNAYSEGVGSYELFKTREDAQAWVDYHKSDCSPGEEFAKYRISTLRLFDSADEAIADYEGSEYERYLNTRVTDGYIDI